MISVKISNAFPEWPLVRQTPGCSGRWNECRFYVNEPVEHCDFWVVYDELMQTETVQCPKENTIFITGEPPHLKRYEPSFLDQFGTIITCHPGIQHKAVVRTQQGLPWHVGRRARGHVNISFSRDYDELKQIDVFDKTKLISAITSNKTSSEGHRKRIEFLKKIERNLGCEIEVFGRGFREIEDKWDAICDFKYHVVIENCACDDYWTEKLADSFLGGAYPFYSGCPNIFDYFPDKSLTVIDIDDFDGSLRLIRDALRCDLYAQSARRVLESRTLVMERYNLFALLSSFCEARPGDCKRTDVTLFPEARFRKRPRNLRSLARWILRQDG